MSLGRLNFDQISEPDLQSLIDTGVPEGISIEYKRGLYSGSDAGVKEFLILWRSFTTGCSKWLRIANLA